MMRRLLPLLLCFSFVFVLGCDDRVHQTDGGGVVLVASLGDTFPFRVSVNDAGSSLQLDFTVESLALAGTSDFMTVELESLEVTFTRADGGTRLPPPLVRELAGVVDPGGSLDYFLTVMTIEQFQNPPLSDLLFENGGFDRETGEANIKLNLHFRFFGRTLGGRDVQSEPRSQTFEFVP